MSSYYPVTQRPLEFELEKDYPLWKDCGFAGLGRQTKSFTYRDSSLYGNHGTLTGFTGAGNTPPERWSRALGRATLSSGTSITQGIRSNVSLVGSLRPKTAVFWIRPNNTSNNKLVFVNTTGSSSSFAIQLIKDLSSWKIGFYSGNYVYSNPWTADTTWNHLCVTWDALDNVAFFLNGTAFGTAIKTAGGTPPNGWQIGYIGGGLNGYFLDSAISDFVVHNRILSAPEISLLADPVRSIDYDGGLVWPRGRSQVWFGAGTPAGNRRRRVLMSMAGT